MKDCRCLYTDLEAIDRRLRRSEAGSTWRSCLSEDFGTPGRVSSDTGSAVPGLSEALESRAVHGRFVQEPTTTGAGAA